LFFLFSAILTIFPTAFLSRLLMGVLGDFWAKRRCSCNGGGRVRHRGFVRESDGGVIRRGAALLTVGENSSAQVRHPSTKLTAFESRELRFRRSLAFAHASAVISDKTRSVRSAEPPQDPLEARVSQGITRLNPLFDASAKTVNINNSQNTMLSADGFLYESSTPN
jgi:hypothetical protein